ncbi:hypothetical protein [Mycobacterium talmoniae]|uniref:Uncharacterized protein n=1 Tax=Mycobacterium talmoniae TaxID=1858794 RepID=A0A1S1NGC9_9MYCO|nr:MULTISPECIES: hypothetical protein [Mycobacterium]OHV03462.1 hypothetical protein BKN37_14735 [Mycobacterium talmoniae]PQM46782.1 hypothetical protein C1Y40_03037 [Mycobacterium talmoniae]TDH53355.1 hypothetical protein E2F47_12775 [Mycobacterium eburneum]
MGHNAEYSVLIDEIPEGDAVEQRRTVDLDDDTGLDTDYLTGAGRDRDANEADLVDQAVVVPIPDDDGYFPQ